MKQHELNDLCIAQRHEIYTQRRTINEQNKDIIKKDRLISNLAKKVNNNNKQPNNMKNKTIIVDLDGTIANIDQRRKESQTKDNKINWDKFFNPQLVLKDKPNTPIINLLNILKDKYNIIITSGRLETTEKATLKWLNKHKVPYNKIYMRKVGDRKSDDKLKEQMLFNDVLPNCNNDINNIEFVLDDRNSVVEKWRQLGLTCLQVDRGDF